MKKFFALNIFLFLFSLTVFSQTSTPPVSNPSGSQNTEQVLTAILSELKQLRSVLAKSSLNQIRFQSAFEQFKSQQNRVDSLNREMESIKNQLISIAPFRTTSDEYIKTTEDRLAQTTDPRQRQTIERQIQTAKRNLEMQDQREKRMKERQTALEIQIPMEQSKLEQLNAEIERIKLDMNSLVFE